MTDYSGLATTSAGRRLAFVCSRSTPLSGPAIEKRPPLLPWWLRALVPRRRPRAGYRVEKISSVPLRLWALALPSGSITCPSTTMGLFQ